MMAQQLMAGRAGLASGIILGLGFVTGAIGVPITGAIADAYGIQTAMRLQVVIVIVTIALATLLPNEGRMRVLTRRDRPATAMRTCVACPLHLSRSTRKK